MVYRPGSALEKGQLLRRIESPEPATTTQEAASAGPEAQHAISVGEGAGRHVEEAGDRQSGSGLPHELASLPLEGGLFAVRGQRLGHPPRVLGRVRADGLPEAQACIGPNTRAKDACHGEGPASVAGVAIDGTEGSTQAVPLLLVG